MTNEMKKPLGQYMTTSEELQEFVFSHISNTGSMLEPSFGQGHLLKRVLETRPNQPMVCCEVDQSLKPILCFNSHQTVIYGDFLKHDFGEQRFKTILGNPPYVKQTAGNLYLQFIEKCYSLLDTDGEIIFIVPSDFPRLTSASKLIDKMYRSGRFTHWLFPHNEHLFEGASIDVVVFRYQKHSETPPSSHSPTQVNGQNMFCNMRNGILTFSNSPAVGIPIADLFHVYVGLVSGKEEVYRVPFGNTRILTDKDTTQNYIFATEFPTESSEINAHMLANKGVLMERKIRRFTESNWFEWGAPRNLAAMTEYAGQQCIYVRNLTRKSEVAFKGTVQPFGGALLCLIPKENQNIDSIVQYLNSEGFRKDYIFSGRFKIGHKQLSNVLISDI